jgi:hypothetical protein
MPKYLVITEFTGTAIVNASTNVASTIKSPSAKK